MLGSYVHSYLNQMNVNILSKKKRKCHTQVHVAQNLVAVRPMKAGKCGKSCLEILKWFIRKVQSDSYRCVMEQSFGGWYIQRTIHVPKKKVRYDTKTPRSEEFEKTVQHPVEYVISYDLRAAR